MDPIKYVFESPFMPGRIAKWQVILSQYDIVYIIKKVVKGSMTADPLAENPINDYEALDFEFLDEHINVINEETEEQDDVWKMYFDGAVNLSSNENGTVLVSPDGKHFSVVVKLRFECTNNVDKYEACVTNLQAAIEIKVKKLEVYGDSALIFYQVKGEWQTEDPKLIPYQKYLLELIKKFKEISFTHLGHDKNQFADALAILAIMTQMEEGREAQLLLIKIWPPSEIIIDNARNLNGLNVQKLCDQYKICYLNSSPYQPQMNGAIEAANKNLKGIIEKITITYKDWHDMLPFALHSYRTTIRMLPGATPYSLVYGMEVVLPIGVEIPSLRILMEAELDETELVKTRLDQLNLINVKRLAVVHRGQLYQGRMARALTTLRILAWRPYFEENTTGPK
ncbi:uncharacterized protein LOC110668448 [Hevea brasiliensis]|uniref:uncharacterized protein LOC110668448 n=1 Tax=Hevea brasiliensis TaxID=3981 RepID=UPI0025DEE1C2|nr:uncharacterized protein LOC110668448 [Hevea brasiliensis]